jgi:hypothetical protein
VFWNVMKKSMRASAEFTTVCVADTLVRRFCF